MSTGFLHDGVALRLSGADERRLVRLGLSPNDLGFFVERFVGHPWEFGSRRVGDGDGGWRLFSRYPLTARDLVRHLAGERWVATGARRDPKGSGHIASYFVADIDHTGDFADLFDRFDRVVAAFGRPTLVFRSSESGGLHVYWFLTGPVDLHRLRPPHNGGLLRTLLAAHGLPEAGGRVELFPRGSYRRHGVQARLRLPFGAQCRLLDPEELVQVNGSAASDLLHVRELFDAKEPRLVSIDDLASRLTSTPRRAFPRAVRGHPPRLIKGTGVDVARLEALGLTGAGQMHAAMFSYGIYLRGQGLTESEVRATLHDRLEQWHNGVSSTYNRSRSDAHAEVDQIVTDLFAVERRPRDWVPLPGLSETEVRWIVEGTRATAALVDPKTGELLARSPEASRYKLQLFLFHVYNQAKQFVLTEARESYGVTGSVYAMRAVWPDPNMPEFVVPRPYYLVDKMRGVSRSAYPALKRAAEAAGLLTPERPPSAALHRAETCRVRLDFCALSRPRLLFPSLADGLARVLSHEEIRELYTSHHARVIRRTGAIPTGIPPALEPYGRLLCAATTDGGRPPSATEAQRAESRPA
jgi:hypothetical protein